MALQFFFFSLWFQVMFTPQFYATDCRMYMFKPQAQCTAVLYWESVLHHVQWRQCIRNSTTQPGYNNLCTHLCAICITDRAKEHTDFLAVSHKLTSHMKTVSEFAAASTSTATCEQTQCISVPHPVKISVWRHDCLHRKYSPQWIMGQPVREMMCCC